MRAISIVATCLLPAIALTGCQTGPTAQVAPGRAGIAARESSHLRLAAYESEDTAPAEKTTAAEKTAAESAPVPPKPIAAESSTRTWTLPELERAALENHPAIEVAAARVEGAKGQWEQAGLYPNPAIGYHATQIGNRDTPGQQGGFVSQKFITAGKLGLDQAVASRQIQALEYGYDGARRRIANGVRTRFYAALVAQKRLEIAEELVRIGNALAESSRKLLQARQAAENELLQAEIEAESARIVADNSRVEYEAALARLAAAAGMNQLANAKLDGELEAQIPEFDRESSLARILAASPELAAARWHVERARAATVRAEREWIPNIDAMVSARHNTINPQHDNVVNIQVGIPLPVFDRNQGNIRKARAEWIAAENAVRRTELDLRDRFAVVYRRYANARQQVDRYSGQILPKARKSLKLVQQGYEKRQVDYLTLLTTQRTYFRTNLAWLDAVWQLRQAAIAIDGLLLTNEPPVQFGR